MTFDGKVGKFEKSKTLFGRFWMVNRREKRSENSNIWKTQKNKLVIEARFGSVQDWLTYSSLPLLHPLNYSSTSKFAKTSPFVH